jgi:hypothetical protein
MRWAAKCLASIAVAPVAGFVTMVGRVLDVVLAKVSVSRFSGFLIFCVCSHHRRRSHSRSSRTLHTTFLAYRHCSCIIRIWTPYLATLPCHRPGFPSLLFAPLSCTHCLGRRRSCFRLVSDWPYRVWFFGWPVSLERFLLLLLPATANGLGG